jgi:rubrerythrin
MDYSISILYTAREGVLKMAENFSIQEAYKIAVVLEDEGFKFYDKIIEAADEVRVKNEIKYLRDEEAKHKAFFQKRVTESGSAMEDAKLQDFIQKEFIGPTSEQFDGDKIKSATAALRFGQTLEKKSIEFYNGIKEKESNAEIIADLDEIIKEEQSHLRKLVVILAY